MVDLSRVKQKLDSGYFWSYIVLAITVIAFFIIAFYFDQLIPAVITLIGGIIVERYYFLRKQKSYPKVFMNFNEMDEPNRRVVHNSREIVNSTCPNYQITYKNEGNKTAKKVNCLVLIASDEEIDVEPSSGGFSSSFEKIEGFDLRDIPPKRYVFEFIFPKKPMHIDELYPNTNYTDGYVSIYESDIYKIKKIIVITLEENGFVKQEFKVSMKGNKKYFEEIKRKFHLH